MRSGVTPDQETIAARLKAADLALEIVKRLRDHPAEVQKLALRQAVRKADRLDLKASAGRVLSWGVLPWRLALRP